MSITSDPRIVYLNGSFLPIADATVSVLDRGFLFGDGVYEVIPVYGKKFFRLPQHIERFEKSLEAIRLKNPFSFEAWEQIFTQLLAYQNPAQADWSVYVQVTRGYAEHRDHAFPVNTHPSVFVMLSPLHALKSSWLTAGVCATTAPDIRWQWCHVKAITLLPNVLLRQQAIESGCMEVILLKDQLLTEGAASNIFVIQSGTVLTPPKSAFLLPGITRDLILELAASAHIPYEEREISREDLKNAEEIWLSSSTKEVLPITQLDHQPVGSGLPGALWTKIYQLYQTFKSNFRG